MKNKSFYTALLMATVSLTFCGCDNDSEDEVSLTDTPLVLTGKIYSFDPEATSAEWKKGKDVGVYLMKEDGEESINSYENVKYKSIEVPAGYFAPPVGNDPIYFPQDGSKANLIVYYPYTENLTENRVSMDISNQKGASPFNFLYSTNCKGINKNQNKVVMELYPVLSEIIIDLVPGNGVTDEYLKESIATMEGMYTKAQFNLLSGQFENHEEKKDIVMKASETANSDTVRVFSTASVEGHKVHISCPKMNRTYTWKLSESMTEIKQGYRYHVNIRVSLETIAVETSEAPIKDWQNGNQTTGNLQENWIEKTIDDLPIGKIKAETAKDKPWLHQIGDWLFIAKGVSQIGEAAVSYDSSLGHNVLHCKIYDNNTWYKTYIANRIPTPKKEVYTLKFKIKGTPNKSIRCFIYREDKKIIAINAADGKYQGSHTFTLTEEYKEYKIDFDFSKQVLSIYNTVTDYTEITDEVLENLFLQFSPTSNETEFDLYDVTLELKKN